MRVMQCRRSTLSGDAGFSFMEAAVGIGVVTVGLLGLAAVFGQGVGMLTSSQIGRAHV